MASTFNFSNAAAGSCAGDGSNQGLKAFLTSGYLIIYAGTQPANADATNSQTALSGHLTFGSLSQSNGALTIPVTSGSCTSSGTAVFFRAFTSADAKAFDGSIGTSGADINFSTTTFVSGGTITITSLVITIPAH